MQVLSDMWTREIEQRIADRQMGLSWHGSWAIDARGHVAV